MSIIIELPVAVAARVLDHWIHTYLANIFIIFGTCLIEGDV